VSAKKFGRARLVRPTTWLVGALMAWTIPAQLLAAPNAENSASATDSQDIPPGEGVRYDDWPVGPADFATSIWDHRNITYFFQTGTNDIDGAGEQQAIRDAFALWAAATPLTFTEVFDTASADITVLWAVGAHGSGDPRCIEEAFDGPYGFLAHTFPPGPGCLGDVHFDDDETWTTSSRTDSNQPIDLVTVAAHELGHALGLDHSSDPEALMFPTYFRSHRFLGQDDIDGIRALYPSSSTFSVGLSASATSVRRRTPVTLTATSSTDVGPTPFFITILQGSKVLKRCASGTTCSVPVVSRRPASATFVARISGSDGSSIQAQSNPVTVTWRRR
jgi:hypothetical protein